MAKNANQQTNAKQKAPVTIENAVASKTKESSSKPILLWGAVVVLLIISAGLYWLIEQQKVQIASMSERIGATSQQFNGQLQGLEQSVLASAASTEQLLENLNSTDIGLTEKIEEIIKVQDMTSDDVKRVWTLSEVEFLLQTANQSVQLAADSEGARQALLLADEKLKELADPRLYRLRAILSDEQLALAAVPKIDIDGMAVRLQSAIERVDNLQVLLAPEHAKQESDTSEPSVLPQDWSSALSSVWQQIRSLVVIRHQQDGAAAVLVPEERYFLYQNMHLKLEAARVALLDGRETLFKDSLTAAEKWLEQYFTGAERDALLASVQSLKAEKITVEMPDISGSLVWLQQNGDQE